MSAPGSNQPIRPTQVSGQSGQAATPAGPTDSSGVALPSAQVHSATPDPNAAARPAWLPLGYETPEQFREAVDNGSYTPGAPAQTAAAVDPAVAPGAEAPAAQPNIVAQFANLTAEEQTKLAPFTAEFEKTGTLTAEAKAAAAKAFGVPLPLVDVYLSGLANMQDSTSKPYYDMFGGKEAYSQFAGWAKTNLSADEIAAYDSALTTAPQAATYMAKQFKARYDASGSGAPARDITAGQSGQVAGQVTDTYGSMAQMVRDMDDARYRTDPAYRKAVEEKLARSPNLR